MHPPLKWKITDATARCPLDFLIKVYTFALKTGQGAMQALLDSTQDAALQQACRDLMTKVKKADPEVLIFDHNILIINHSYIIRS
jgi:hypothetical protein